MEGCDNGGGEGGVTLPGFSNGQSILLSYSHRCIALGNGVGIKDWRRGGGGAKEGKGVN